ncbi:MAG: arylsulfatase, partial [Verrucomicrobiota bacterium]
MKTLRFFSLFLLLTLTFAKADDRPDIILIMVDDLGFSDLGYMGGEIETPHLDGLATGGIRFSQFYNSGRCCPTRATLLTGLHPHETGIGWMTESPTSRRGSSEPPAYQGHLNDNCATIAEMLSDAGYATLMTGKWHLGHHDEEDWPLQRGFEKFYGCIAGATRFFTPEYPRGMVNGNEPVEKPASTTDEAFYTTDAFTDHAIKFLEEEQNAADRPSFLYLAYTAPHWPLQAFEDDIEKYRGQYQAGWQALRETRFAKQKELGLFAANASLSPTTAGIPDWTSLTDEQRDELDLKMAVYAAMVDRVDQNIGKLVEALKTSGRYENTLILFLSDNGACQEGGLLGRGEFRNVKRRNQQDANSYGEAWANAGSTPYRKYKHYTHEGGIASPFFAHWPASIEPHANWFRSPAQLIDIVPTLLELAEADYPDRENLPPLDGVSLVPAFSGDAIERPDPIYFEHETHAAVRNGQWKLVGSAVSMFAGTDSSKWELYDLAADPTETQDLAALQPERVKEMANKWESWANRVGVYPRGEKSPASAKPAHSAAPKADEPELMPEDFTPQIEGRAFTVTATVRNAKPNGVVLAQGGNAFGYSLYFI